MKKAAGRRHIQWILGPGHGGGGWGERLVKVRVMCRQAHNKGRREKDKVERYLIWTLYFYLRVKQIKG